MTYGRTMIGTPRSPNTILAVSSALLRGETITTFTFLRSALSFPLRHCSIPFLESLASMYLGL